MMRLGHTALCVVLLCLACADAQSAPGDPMVHHYVVISNAEVVGGLQVVRRGNRLDVDYHIEDNGRGPRTKESIELGADGLPHRWRISGSAETGARISESFEWRGRRARWRTLNDRGAVTATEPRLYLAGDASPYSLAVYAKALLSAPDHMLRGWPAGSVRAERVIAAAPGALALPPAAQVWVLWGIDVAPAFLLLDADGGFLACLSADRLIIPEAWRGNGAALSRFAATLDHSLLGALTQKLMHSWDVPLYLRDVRIFDPVLGALSPQRTVVTFRSRITGVLPADTAPPAGAVAIDGDGGTVMAALFDMHAHVSAWQGPLYLAEGVTTVRDMGNDNAALLDLIAEFDSGRIAGPAVVPSGFLEGRSPFSARDGIIASDLPSALAGVRWYADRGYWQIKIYNSVDPDWVAPIAAQAHDLGLRVAGHVPAFMSSERAILDGYDEITHLNQLILSLLIDPKKDDTRTPFRFTALGERLGSLDLQAAPFQSLVHLMQTHHTVLDPTAAILSQMLLARAGSVTPVDAPWIDHVPGPIQRSRKAAMLSIPPGEDQRYRTSETRLLETLRSLHDKGISLVPGSDDFPGFMLVSELETWQRAGIAPAEILQLATLGCARYLRVDQELGSIERGKRADLILMVGDPTRDVGVLRHLRMVMKGGAVLFPEEVYTAMQIEPFAGKPSFSIR